MSFQMDKLMKQAAEMQKKMQQVQKEMEEITMIAFSGGDAVKAVKKNNLFTAIKISPDLLPGTTAEQLEIVEDLIVAAINSATKKIEEASKDKIASITAGIKLPENLGG